VTQSIHDVTLTQTRTPSLAVRLAWTILIFGTLYLCYFHNLGAIGLVGPDEPRYAWIARDMGETGDWITPHLYGKPWFEKPPLYYWSAALSFKLFGVSETTARLPSAIYALLATLAMAWLAWHIYGAETARWLLLLLPTTVGMIAFSHAAATDMPFGATLTMAMVFAAKLLGLVSGSSSEERQVTSPRQILFSSPTLPNALLFGFFMGLAVLAKGPAALILSGGSVFLWAIFIKRWRDAFRCLHPAAIGAFCATALPWYVLCARRNPDFFRIFIIEHNFKRFLTPEFQHIQPFWYYGGILLLAFLPWTLLLLYSVIRGSFELWRARTISHATLFLLCWSLFVVVFFSISKSKLPGYILPTIPAIALLIVRGYLGAKYRNEMVLRWLLTATGMLGLVAFALAFTLPFGTDARVFHIGACVVLGLTLPHLLLGLPESSRRLVFYMTRLSVVPLLVLLCFYQYLQSTFLSHHDISGKTLAAELVAKNIPPEDLYVGHMQRGQQYSLSFYLRREIRSWSEEPREGYLLSSGRNCKNVITAPWMCSDEPVFLERSGYFLYRVWEVR
jgi:4-amino-4-deoxy-L-arabinose transferase-like glycosyltransferase